MAVNWDNVLTNTASFFTIVAAFGGSVIAIFYGRKANATVTAAAQRTTAGSIVLAVRPTVQATGLFKIRIQAPDQASVIVTEVLRSAQGPVFGKVWKNQAVFAKDSLMPGETLTSAIIFDVGAPTTELDGWMVGLAVDARRLPFGPASWDDRIYVAIPKPEADRHEPERGEDEKGEAARAYQPAQPRLRPEQVPPAAAAIDHGFIASIDIVADQTNSELRTD
jgi:hypothetical protein